MFLFHPKEQPNARRTQSDENNWQLSRSFLFSMRMAQRQWKTLDHSFIAWILFTEGIDL
jgi:hypothetical protein